MTRKRLVAVASSASAAAFTSSELHTRLTRHKARAKVALPIDRVERQADIPVGGEIAGALAARSARGRERPVADEPARGGDEGDAGFADEIHWYPANTSDPDTTTGGPFGSYTATEWRILTPYLDGTDTSEQHQGGSSIQTSVDGGITCKSGS